MQPSEQESAIPAGRSLTVIVVSYLGAGTLLLVLGLLVALGTL